MLFTLIFEIVRVFPHLRGLSSSISIDVLQAREKRESRTRQKSVLEYLATSCVHPRRRWTHANNEPVVNFADLFIFDRST